MIIRDLTPADTLALANIHLQTFDLPWSLDAFHTLLRDQTCRGWMIGNEVTSIGFLLVRVVLDQSDILTLAILPMYHKRGFGQKLVERYLSHLRAQGIRQAFLEVDVNNDAAIKLYKKCQFHEIGTRPDYYEHPDGTRTAALLMRYECFSL